MSSGSYSALALSGRSLRRSRSTAAPSEPAWRRRVRTWSWSPPAARLPRRAPHTASAALMPAWMARLVAAMLRRASRSLLAASANSCALAAYERTCAAATVVVRVALANGNASKLVDAPPLHDATVPMDVDPERTAAGHLLGGLIGAHLEDLDPVPGSPLHIEAPTFE